MSESKYNPDPSEPPTLVRGLLILNVVKPTRISSIEVELNGVATTSWPEGVGTRRVEITEAHKIYSASTTAIPRRPVAMRPRSSATHSPLTGHSPERRNVAGDVQPRSGTSHPHTGSFGVGNAVGENPAQTLEELRQALRDNLEGHVYSHGRSLTISVLAASPPSSFLSHRASFSLPTPPMTQSSASSISNVSLPRENDTASDGSHESALLSRYSSTEEELSQTRHSFLRSYSNSTSVARTSRTCSPENMRTSDVHRAHDTSHDAPHTRTGRTHSHFSLSAVLGAVKEVATGERSRSRDVDLSGKMERGRARTRVGDDEDAASNTNGRYGSVTGGANSVTPMSQPGHHLLGLGRIFGLDRDNDDQRERSSKEQGDGWKEFKKGSYTYPISFLLPPHLPPTLAHPHGTIVYSLKGVVHRPGTFTSKLSTYAPILVVAAPSVMTSEGGGDGDLGPVILERQWQSRLAYIAGLNGRVLVVGSQRGLDVPRDSLAHGEVEASADAAYGTVTLDLTLMPIEKIRVWRLSVYIDEQVKYVGRGVRDAGVRRVTLLDVEDVCSAEDAAVLGENEKRRTKQMDKGAVQVALLPTPFSPHRSPLLRYLPASADSSILAGPGPYTLSATVGLSGCNDGNTAGLLHPTVKHKNSNVQVDHVLRIMIRVQKVGEDGASEQDEGGKQKLFDISIHTPVTILSVSCLALSGLCDAHHARRAVSLHPRAPNASYVFPDHARRLTVSGGMSVRLDKPGRRGEGQVRDIDQIVSSDAATPSGSGSGAGRGRDAPVHVDDGQRERPEVPSRAHSHPRAQPHPPHAPPSRPQPSLVSQQTQNPDSSLRYERLVSGLESEAGEAPPAYESVAGSL
ncbi:hypothetical protein BU15DRAFT_61972 [Melanogaster broomeanus]|nr:hypothetical protein BU15DRAFT_61972 [Melanogaster broomeanus]